MRKTRVLGRKKDWLEGNFFGDDNNHSWITDIQMSVQNEKRIVSQWSKTGWGRAGKKKNQRRLGSTGKTTERRFFVESSFPWVTSGVFASWESPFVIGF